jgi:NitT/TauT family transport system substrate-binding protein
MKRLITSLPGLLVVSILIAACGSAAPTSRAPLKVGWVLRGGWYPIVIAQQKGLFEKHGVAVEPIFYQTYSSVPTDFAASNIDGALMSLYDVLPIESRDRANPDRVVMITDDTVGADAILAQPNVTSVADLKGKRLGVKFGSYVEVMVSRMLQLNHLSPADVQLVNVEPENALQALQAHQVDAVHSFEPVVSQVAAKGFRIIFSSAKTPGLMPNVLAFKYTVVRDRPEDVKAFVSAWMEAQALWQADMQSGNQLIAQATGQKPADISLKGIALRTLADNQSAFRLGADTTSVYYSAQVNLDFLVNSGNISKVPDLQKLLDPSFIK